MTAQWPPFRELKMSPVSFKCSKCFILFNPHDNFVTCKYPHITDGEAELRRAKKLAHLVKWQTCASKAMSDWPQTPPSCPPWPELSSLIWSLPYSGYFQKTLCELPENESENSVHSLSWGEANGFKQILKRTPDPQSILEQRSPTSRAETWCLLSDQWQH